MSTFVVVANETIRLARAAATPRPVISGKIQQGSVIARTAKVIPQPRILGTPYTPYSGGITGYVGAYNHYFVVKIYSPAGVLLDVPQADIVALSITDVINGGSSTGSIKFRRSMNAIGAIGFQNRVLVWFWSGYQAMPTDPYWAGYMLDIDADAKTNPLLDGEITVDLEGDQKQLDYGIVTETWNPGVAGNPSVDTAAYLNYLMGTYARAGFAALSIPSSMFPCLPMQFYQQGLSSVIDTVVKTGEDQYGSFYTWRVRSQANLTRTFIVQPDQNPNVYANVQFKHIFRDAQCAKYTISTKYRDVVNVLLVTGGQDPTTGNTVAGVYEDTNSVAAYGAIEGAVTVVALLSQALCQQYGKTYLAIHANPQAQGSVELLDPDPSIFAGTWVQFWETPTTIKQVRIGQVTVDFTPTRVKQTLQPIAPVPYLDDAVYQLGNNVANNVAAATLGLSSAAQQAFVRTGAVITGTT